MTANSPYGFTFHVPNDNGHPPLLPAQTITDLLAWGGSSAGLWLRYQLHWNAIEQTQGVYTWTNLDDAVAKCNANGINMVWPLQSAPTWYLTISAQDGSTVPAGTGDLPNASAVATFAAAVAQRYNGTNGHGTIAAIQIGNEEWDSIGANNAIRDLQGAWLNPCIVAAYPAIKAVYPTCQVGSCAVRKTPQKALTHITNWLNNLFSYKGSGIATTIKGDNSFFIDFHYYRGGASAGEDPTTQDADTPSVATELATIISIAKSYGCTPQVWCGETGWDIYDDGTCINPPQTVSTALQSQYMIDMSDAMRTGGGSKILYFTVNNTATVTAEAGCSVATQKSTSPKSISQIISGVYTYEPAYTAIQSYQVAHPTWNLVPPGNQNQGSDTFLTAGRGTPNAWSPASDAESWTQALGTSTLSFTGSKGQLTGSKAINALLLGTKKFYDSEVVCRLSHSAVADSSAVIARATSTNTYYYAEYINGALNISKSNNGGNSILATYNFGTEVAGQAYWVRFKVQGFGTWTPNLFARIWADGTTEPGTWQVQASDSVITGPGQFGVRAKASATTTTQSYDTFFSGDPQASLPAPANNIASDLPYGMTYYVSPSGGSPLPINQQIINDVKGWAPGCWIRYQLQWLSIEQVQGQYYWSVLDDAVARCNIAGVNMCLCLQNAPTFRLTIRATDGTTVASGTGDLPGGADMATFATAVATRYNGKSGFGLISALQIGNEEWDSFGGNNATRDLQGEWLVPVVKAAYPAIRAAGFTGYIGVCAVRKTQTTALTHITNWMTNLWTYQGGIGPTISGDNKFFLDFHYYRDGASAGPDPTTQDADTPSVATEIATIESVAAAAGFAPLIWCGETGWNVYDDGTCHNPANWVTFAQQSSYIQSMFDALRTGGGQKCFVFTLEAQAVVKSETTTCATATVYSTSIKSIVQTISSVYTHLQAYTDIGTYLAAHPVWAPPPPGNQNQGSDTFLTDSRGTPNAWSPASDGENWTQAAGTSTMSIVGSKGQLTGSTSINAFFLGTKKYYDSEVVCRMSHSAVLDSSSLIGRATASNTYYYARYSNGALTLNLFNAGTSTQLATFAFTETAGALYWMRFKVQGFGTWTTNLSAKIWADGAAEPAGWQVTASDSVITAPGQFGVRGQGNANGSILTYDTFFSGDPSAQLPTPTNNVTRDTPYGTTYAVAPNSGSPAIINQTAINDVKAWVAGGTWIRYMLQWQSIEQIQGQYYWSVLDDAVARANINGVNMCFVITGAPSFRLTVSAATGGAGTDLPSGADVATFAGLVATRYNGSNGVGTIQAFQIGSEDWDSLATRDQQAQWLVPVIKAAYPVIRAANANCYIIAGAVKRTATAGLTHITNWMTNLWTYQNGIGLTVAGDTRFVLDFHYYRDGATAGLSPTVQDADTPSISTVFSTIQSIAKANGNTTAQIWCSETGWSVYDSGACDPTSAYTTQALQSTYIQAVYDALRTLGGKKVFVFTLDATAVVAALGGCGTATVYSTVPKSIVQTISSVYTHLQAYTDIGTYEAAHPVWTPNPPPPPEPAGNQNQGSDTFATNSRGTPNTWSPASDGENWAQVVVGSTMSFSGTQGQFTGTTTFNVALLGSRKYYDSEVVARIAHSNVLDSSALVARATASNTYYYANYSNGALNINAFNNGAKTQLATFAFTEVAGTEYWVRFKVQGFGLWTPNLFAKIWADGTSEPAGWQITASDSSITAPGQFGIRCKGATTGSTQSFDSFFSGDPLGQLPAPANTISADSPYGMSYTVPTNNGAPALINAQTIADMLAIDYGTWIRYKLQWQSIEQTQGVYFWSVLDDAVARANIAGVNLCFCIQNAPSFRLTVSATTGGVGADLPSATDVATFAALVAARYNGQSGYGTIGAIQIGSEDWDALSPRDSQAQWLVPVINAAYAAIRNAGFLGYIVACAVRATSTLGLTHIQNWMNALWTYQGGIGSSAAGDGKFVLDFHFYRDGATAGLNPLSQDANTPSIATTIYTIQSIARSYGFTALQIWCSETGWSAYDDGTCNPTNVVSQATQSQYIQAIFDAMRTGGGFKVFVFTLDATATVTNLNGCASATVKSSVPKSLVQTISSVYTYNQAYTDWDTYETNYPNWPPLPPAPPPTVPNLTAVGRRGTMIAIGRKA